MANGNIDAVDEAGASAFSEAGQLKERGHLNGHPRHQFHEPVVGYGIGEILLQVALDVAQIIVLEVAVDVEMEADEGGHNLAVDHPLRKASDPLIIPNSG